MIYSLQYLIKIIIAELIFLYPVQKKKLFFLKFIVGFIAVLILNCVILPSYLIYDSSILLQFLMVILMFSSSVLIMGLCFNIKINSLISCCVAGYAIEHISFHFANIADYYNFLGNVIPDSIYHRVMVESFCTVIIYLIALFTIGRFSAKNQCYKKSDMRFSYIAITIIFICIVLTRSVRKYGMLNMVPISLYAITSCVLALTIQFVLYTVVDLQYENTTMNLLLKEKQRQYELSKKTIDTINIKYHDLKHKLKHMNLPKEELDTIRESIRIYGSQVITGNEALDVILTENSIRCSEESIQLTCTGNGQYLDFMSTMDVYSLFGNAVENAIEAVRKIKDPEKKVIDMVIEKVGDMVTVNITNYFDDLTELEIDDDLPVTTKKEDAGFHGFGMKSMRLISEKYGGNITVSLQKDLFILNIYLLRA